MLLVDDCGTWVLFAAAAGNQDHGGIFGGGGPSKDLRGGAAELLPVSVGIPLIQQPAPYTGRLLVFRTWAVAGLWT